MEMIMTGDNVDAEEAYRIGIANKLCSSEELESTTMNLAQTIASKSMHTLRVAKRTIRAALDNSITEGVAIEAEAFANLFDTEDKEIGVQAFLNRETPEWKHR
jgi:enoyl-CoA hydratase